MMELKLRPGDYVMASDIENEEMHNAIREAFVAAACVNFDCALGWEGDSDRDNSFIYLRANNSDEKRKRRVYPHQILAKPMLIEALKPGMRAKLLTGTVRHNESGFVKWESTSEYCNHATLTTTEYEIIPDGPKPWVAKDGDHGWGIDDNFKAFDWQVTISKSALRTKQAAEHMAKIKIVYTAIMNMPGAFDGNNAHVYWNFKRFHCGKGMEPDGILDIPFDTYENAQAAAKEANRIIEEME